MRKAAHTVTPDKACAIARSRLALPGVQTACLRPDQLGVHAVPHMHVHINIQFSYIDLLRITVIVYRNIHRLSIPLSQHVEQTVAWVCLRMHACSALSPRALICKVAIRVGPQATKIQSCLIVNPNFNVHQGHVYKDAS